MDSGSKLEAVWARNLKVLLLGWDGLEGVERMDSGWTHPFGLVPWDMVE